MCQFNNAQLCEMSDSHDAILVLDSNISALMLILIKYYRDVLHFIIQDSVLSLDSC